MAYAQESRRFVSRGNNGESPPRTAGMRNLKDLPLQKDYKISMVSKIFLYLVRYAKTTDC